MESDNVLSVSAAHFVWPERAITEIQLFKPTSAPQVSIVKYRLKEDSSHKSYAVRFFRPYSPSVGNCSVFRTMVDLMLFMMV